MRDIFRTLRNADLQSDRTGVIFGALCTPFLAAGAMLTHSYAVHQICLGCVISFSMMTLMQLLRLTGVIRVRDFGEVDTYTITR